jgi:hypothetical protein
MNCRLSKIQWACHGRVRKQIALMSFSKVLIGARAQAEWGNAFPINLHTRGAGQKKRSFVVARLAKLATLAQTS